MTALQTALVERPRLARTDAASGERSAGAYRILRRVLRGPGADLWAGTGPDGDSVLVQSVILRAVDSHAEAVERSHVERALIAQAQHDDADVLARGAVDRAEGLREIYWVLREPRGIPAVEPLNVALDLARRLADDHRLGRSAPLLDATFLAEREGRATVVGVAVAAPVEWLAPGALSWRSAPEEAIRRSPSVSGDLWRLGQTLSAYAHGHTIPEALQKLIEALAGPVHRRPSRATEVVAWIEAMLQPKATLDTVEYSATGLDLLGTFVRDHAATTFDAPRELETTLEAPMWPSSPEGTIAVVTLVPADIVADDPALPVEPIETTPVARIGIPVAKLAERPLIEDDADQAFFETTPLPNVKRFDDAWLIFLVGLGALLGVIAALY